MVLKVKNNKYIIYLNKQTDNDFNDNNIEDYFMKLLNNINRKYNIELNGLYDLTIYKDKYYGSVIEMVHKEYDYILYNEIDLNIKMHKDDFLYEIDNYNFDKNKFDYFLYKNKIYLKIKNDISDKDMYNLLENSNLKYDTENLILSSKKI